MQISYDITIEVKQCPENREDWKKSFSIYPVGLTEQLKINLEFECDCACEAMELGVSNKGYRG